MAVQRGADRWICGTSTMRMPSTGASTACTSAAFICSSVTRPKRLAWGTGLREEPHERIEGFEENRPAPAGSQHVPGPKDRGIQSERANPGLHGRARRNIRLHDRRGLGHAYIDKMANAAARRSFRSGTPRGLID